MQFNTKIKNLKKHFYFLFVMKIAFITGATGFIGANLTRELLGRNFDVHIIARATSNTWRINDIKDKISVHNINILDSKRITNLVKRINPDYIFHLAAYGSYPRIQTDDKKIIKTNLIGTHNLLTATLDIPYKCFVNTGSSSEYGIKNKSMKESDALEPNMSYGVAKAAATMLCQYFATIYKKPIVTLRPFSVYGYYEEKFRLVPDVILNCINGNDVELTSGEQKRDFIFIEDMIKAYMKAIEKPSVDGLIFNVGSGRDASVKEIAETIHKMVGSKNKLIFGKKKRESFETDISWRADITKIKKVLNWKPKTSLQEGLKKTIEWFKKNKHPYN